LVPARAGLGRSVPVPVTVPVPVPVPVPVLVTVPVLGPAPGVGNGADRCRPVPIGAEIAERSQETLYSFLWNYPIKRSFTSNKKLG
jgi:hypothetical protein